MTSQRASGLQNQTMVFSDGTRQRGGGDENVCRIETRNQATQCFLVIRIPLSHCKAMVFPRLRGFPSSSEQCLVATMDEIEQQLGAVGNDG